MARQGVRLSWFQAGIQRRMQYNRPPTPPAPVRLRILIVHKQSNALRVVSYIKLV